jgi:hypothetical protein
MYGKEPNDFIRMNYLSEQDELSLWRLVASQRERLVALTLEFSKSSCPVVGGLGWASRWESKRNKLLQKIHMERVALDDLEYAHSIAVKNSASYLDWQAEFSDALENLRNKDKERIDNRTEHVKTQDEDHFILKNIQNLLADFIGTLELKILDHERKEYCKSGGTIAGVSYRQKSGFGG